MTVAKHVQLGHIHLMLDEHASKGGARTIDPNRIIKVGGHATAVRLSSGMKPSGRSAVIVQVDLDDGSTLLLETSLALLHTMVVAFKARDQMEGRPE